MKASGELSVDLPEDEWAALVSELDNQPGSLTAAACAALLSAAPSPAGISGARWFTCSVAVARELLRWCEAAAGRWRAYDPEAGAILDRAARNLTFALWRVGEGPPPKAIQYRP